MQTRNNVYNMHTKNNFDHYQELHFTYILNRSCMHISINQPILNWTSKSPPVVVAHNVQVCNLKRVNLKGCGGGNYVQ